MVIGRGRLNMGRDYIHELYLTPSDSEGLNLMNIMLVVYGYSRICEDPEDLTIAHA
jgi:hypothetical protein